MFSCVLVLSVECVRDCTVRTIKDLIGIWLAILQSLVLVWSHRTLMESSELTDDRLWLSKNESSNNCNTKFRMCNSKRPKLSRKNAQNLKQKKSKYSRDSTDGAFVKRGVWPVTEFSLS